MGWPDTACLRPSLVRCSGWTLQRYTQRRHLDLPAANAASRGAWEASETDEWLADAVPTSTMFAPPAMGFSPTGDAS